MVIGVLGGTGTAGRAVTAELRRRGHEAIVLSRSAPREGPHRTVDVSTGAGLDDSMTGLDGVVEVVSGARSVKVDGIGQAVRAARAAGVGHWLSLSVIGAGAVPFSYGRSMGRREELVRAAEVPSSILRATQFHTLLGMVFGASARRGLLPLLRVPIQPVDVRDVAVALADRVEAGPSGMAEELTGPRIERLDELARAWAQANGVHRVPLRIPVLGRGLRAVQAGALINADAPHGTITFAEWLQAETRPSVTGAHEGAAGWV